MNKEQLNKVKIGIQSLKEIDIIDVISKYIGTHNSETEDVISVKNIPNYFTRIIERFESEMKEEEFVFYPDSIKIGEETLDLTFNLSHLRGHLKNNDIKNAIIPLKNLVYYQMVHGFWNEKYKESKNDKVSKEILKLKSDAELLLNLSNATYNEIDLKIKELDKAKQELENFKKEKTDELGSLVGKIDENIKASKNTVGEINELLVSSAINDEHIKGLAKESETKKSEIEKIVNDWTLEHEKNQKEVEAFKTRMAAFSEEVSANRKDFDELYNEINTKKVVFDERIQLLTDLIGHQVGDSLSESFVKRVKSLRKSVVFWGIAILVVAGGDLVFITNLVTTNESSLDIWQRISYNALKAIPAIFLLYYTISQYNKERNFQEAYAFKSAVALTIMAYRDQLVTPDKKEDFIMESVRNIYISPDINQSKLDSKDVNSVLDMLKAVKDLKL